jgi:hypothetical protein
MYLTKRNKNIKEKKSFGANTNHQPIKKRIGKHLECVA